MLPPSSVTLKHRYRATVKAFLYLIFCVFAISYSGHTLAQEPELPEENQKDYVSDVLPYGIDFVRDRINLEFDSNDRAFFEDYNSAIYELPRHAKTIRDLSQVEYNKFLEFPLVRKNKFYVFYAAYRNMQQALQEITPYQVAGVNNPALQRYANVAAKERRNDIYLWSPDTPFWRSEYFLNGEFLPFRAYFIVHLSPVDEFHTSVEVIEDKPAVKMGNRLSVDANGVVRHFDIRDVAPTTRDRKFMLSCIKQFIDRKLPGRHWFNCNDE